MTDIIAPVDQVKDAKHSMTVTASSCATHVRSATREKCKVIVPTSSNGTKLTNRLTKNSKVLVSGSRQNGSKASHK